MKSKFSRSILFGLVFVGAMGRPSTAEDPPGVVSSFSTPDDSGLTQAAISPTNEVRLGSSRGSVWAWSPTEEFKEWLPQPKDNTSVSNLRFDAQGNLFLRRGRDLEIFGTNGQHNQVNLPSLSLLDIAPSGKQLAAIGEEPPILFFAAQTGEKQHRVDRQVRVDELHYSPTSRHLATATYGRLYLWNSRSGELVWKARLEGNIRGFAFAPDGETIFTAVAREGVWSIDVETGHVRERFSRFRPLEEDEEQRPLRISPDGTLLAESLPDHRIEIWETFTGQPVQVLAKHPGEISDLQFFPDGVRLLSVDQTGQARVWNLAVAEWAAPFDVAREYSEEDLGKLWRMLGEPRGQAAWTAMVALKHRPAQALELLDDPPNDQQLIQELIERLDHDQFAVRQSAYRTLRQLSLKAEPLLKQALGTSRSVELKTRIRRLLTYLNGPQREAQRELLEQSRFHRQLRAIQLLKWIGTPEAQTRLEKLWESSDEPAVRQQAQAALGWLKAEKRDPQEN